MTERSVTGVLAALSIEYPPLPDLDPAFARIREPQPARHPVFRLRWAAALALVAVAAVLTLVTPAREAVADWLGIGAVRIVEVEEGLEGLERSLGDLGVAVPIEDAGWRESPLGVPDEAFVQSEPDAVTLVWLPRLGLPEVDETGIGALFTLFDGSLDGPVIEKSVGTETTVEIVEVSDVAAYWVHGEAHSFAYLDPSGEVVVESLRLVGNTLLWEKDGISYRLESALDLEQAVAAAEALGG